MSSGIYLITNLINDKVYVGSSIRIQRRWIEHKCDLKKQHHKNRHLQRAWNKYGKKNFVFEILELCDIIELSEREIYWSEIYDVYNRKKGYNIRGVGDHPFVSEETRTLLSKMRKGKKMPEEAKRNMSIAQKKRIAEGRGQSKESIRKRADKRKGQRHTEETKANISRICKEKNTNRKAVMMFDMDGNYLREFESLADAARFLGIINKEYNYGSLNSAASGKRKQAYGYKWRLKTES